MASEYTDRHRHSEPGYYELGEVHDHVVWQ
jgi:hypothetical protein